MLSILDTPHSTPWAMTHEALAALMDGGAGGHLARAAGPISARRGRPLVGARSATVRDGVATIVVSGALCARDAWYGAGASYADIAADVRVALRNPKVTALILAIDSHGGELNGAASLVEFLHGSRGRKRIVAIANDIAAASAYWIASAADEVVTTPMGVLGSIGLHLALRDTSEREAREGVRTIEIISSQSPRKVPDPKTPNGRAQIRATLNALAGIMVDSIARNRATTTERVLEDFGKGGVLVGADAVRAGLADRVSTYEALHAELARGVRRAAPASAQRAAQQAAQRAVGAPPARTPSGLTQAQAEALAAHRAREAAERAARAEAARKAARERAERERPAREAREILNVFRAHAPRTGSRRSKSGQ